MGRALTAETNERASSGHGNLKCTALVNLYGASAGTAGRTPAWLKNSFAIRSASSSAVFSPMAPSTAMFPHTELAADGGGAAVEEAEPGDEEEIHVDTRRTSASILNSSAAYWFLATVSTVFADRFGPEDNASSLASTFWNCSSCKVYFACTISI